MKRKLSQLRAISRSCTKKAQKDARQWLLINYGISYNQYAARFDFKGSPCQLASFIRSGAIRTMQNVIRLQNELECEQDQELRTMIIDCELLEV